MIDEYGKKLIEEMPGSGVLILASDGKDMDIFANVEKKLLANMIINLLNGVPDVKEMVKSKI